MIDDPLLGHQLANFRLDHVIGRGGMAQVYYGWDVKLQRAVALKVIDARYRDKPDYAERFVREARSVATWNHPNITQIYYADDEEGLYYYVMEYIAGLDLNKLIAQYVEDGTFMPHTDTIRIARGVANALDYAHEKGIVHRDVKPSNVMVADDGRVLLADFGLALDSSQGSLGDVFGSPHYMAPEQAHNSASVVSQSDLYSLAVILYEMLTGIPPFDDPAPAALALQHITKEVPSPRDINTHLNDEVEAVLFKALSKSPYERYATGKELVDALERALKSGSDVERPPPPAGANIPRPPMPAMGKRQTDSITVAERIALHLENNPPIPEKAAAQRPRNDKPYRISPILPIIVGLLTLIGLGFISLSLFGNQPQTVATAEPSKVAATDEPISAIETTVSTPPPAVIDPPETSTPTATSTARPPATATATDSPPPTITSSPTILHPNGRLLRFVYNDFGFYLLNLGSSDLEVRRLTFELLLPSGQPSAYRFDGQAWASFYPFISNGWCNYIELYMPGEEPLRPGSCDDINARRENIDPNSSDVFWLSHNTEATQFRILWNEGEVGRCELTRGRCDVYVP